MTGFHVAMIVAGVLNLAFAVLAWWLLREPRTAALPTGEVGEPCLAEH